VSILICVVFLVFDVYVLKSTGWFCRDGDNEAKQGEAEVNEGTKG
jgi:hypothetical protein